MHPRPLYSIPGFCIHQGRGRSLQGRGLNISATWLWIMDAVQSPYPQSSQVSPTLSPSYSQNRMAGQSSKHRSPSALQYDRHRSSSRALSIALVRSPYTHARSQNSENFLLLRASARFQAQRKTEETLRDSLGLSEVHGYWHQLLGVDGCLSEHLACDLLRGSDELRRSANCSWDAETKTSQGHHLNIDNSVQ